jgi:hypothetical protein
MSPWPGMLRRPAPLPLAGPRSSTQIPTQIITAFPGPGTGPNTHHNADHHSIPTTPNTDHHRFSRHGRHGSGMAPAWPGRVKSEQSVVFLADSAVSRHGPGMAPAWLRHGSGMCGGPCYGVGGVGGYVLRCGGRCGGTCGGTCGRCGGTCGSTWGSVGRCGYGPPPLPPLPTPVPDGLEAWTGQVWTPDLEAWTGQVWKI